MDKREFAKMGPDKNAEIFIVYVAVLLTILIHLDRKLELKSLFINEAPT